MKSTEEQGFSVLFYFVYRRKNRRQGQDVSKKVSKPAVFPAMNSPKALVTKKGCYQWQLLPLKSRATKWSLTASEPVLGGVGFIVANGRCQIVTKYVEH